LGAPIENNQAGAVYVYTRDGNNWSQQSVLNGNGGGSYFGWLTSLSADGNILAIGAPIENNFAGAVYVYTRDGNIWSQQSVLTGSGQSDFGWSTSLSDDGNILAVGQ